MEDKQPKSLKKILKTYDPIAGFQGKHEGESREEFEKYLNK